MTLGFNQRFQYRGYIFILFLHIFNEKKQIELHSDSLTLKLCGVVQKALGNKNL